MRRTIKRPTFVRYGGLSSVKQKGYTTDPDAGFHSPPARRGIYAFVQQFVEHFLLGGTDFDSRRMVYARDAKGNLLSKGHPEYEKIHTECNKNDDLRVKWGWGHHFVTKKDGTEVIVHNKKPVKFQYDGDIWHHLEVPNDKVLARKGSWVKTDMLTYTKALQKEIGRYVASQKSCGYGYTIDHLEVFIEKV